MNMVSRYLLLVVFCSFIFTCQDINVDADRLKAPTITNGRADNRYTTALNNGASITHTNDDAEMHFTVNGDVPTSSSPEFSGFPVDLAAHDRITIRAICTSDNYTDSPVTTVTFYKAWRSLPDVPDVSNVTYPGYGSLSLENPGLAVVGDYLYVIGGSRDNTAGGGRLCFTECYRINTSTGVAWEAIDSLNTARDAFAVAVIGSTIYVIGGINNASTNTRTVEYLDPSAGTPEWTLQGTVLSHDIEQSGCAVLDSVAYLLSGKNGNACYSYTPGIDLVTEPDVWTDGGDMVYCAAAATGGKIYAIGGKPYEGPAACLSSFTPSTDTWDSSPQDYSIGITRVGAAVANSRIYSFGGYQDGAISNLTRVYTPASNSWSQDFAMPASRVHPRVASDGENIYIVGGMNGTAGPYTDTVWVFAP